MLNDATKGIENNNVTKKVSRAPMTIRITIGNGLVLCTLSEQHEGKRDILHDTANWFK